MADGDFTSFPVGTIIPLFGSWVLGLGYLDTWMTSAAVTGKLFPHFPLSKLSIIDTDTGGLTMSYAVHSFISEMRKNICGAFTNFQLIFRKLILLGLLSRERKFRVSFPLLSNMSNYNTGLSAQCN